MTRKSNPFTDLLGLDFVAPSHFQLLGLDPTVTDRRIIKQAAGATLEKLGDRPTNSKDLENWRLVRRRIKLAYQCLSDDVRRKEYLEHLWPPQDKHEIPPPAAQNEGTRTHTPQNENDGKPTSNTPAEIPMAIPLAIPMAEVLEEEPKDYSLAESPPTSPILVLNKGRRKSKVLPFFKLAILLLITAGISYVGFESVVKPMLEGNSPNLALLPTQQTPSGTRPDSPPDSLPDSRSIPKKRPSSEVPSFPPKKNSVPKSQPKLDAKPPVQPPPPVQPVPTQTAPAETSWANLTPAEFPSAFGFLHHIESASLCMKRREWKRMDRLFEDARVFVRDQNALDIYLEHQLVAEAYRNFWQRVEKNARELASMKEFKINDRTLVIVEAKPDSLVYRVGGNRIENRYQQLPLLVGLAVCEQGASGAYESIASDRLVVYSVAARFNPEYLPKARELANQEEQLGYSTSALRAFYEKDIESLYQIAGIEPVTAKVIRRDKLISKTAKSEPVMREITQLDAAEFRQRMGELKMALLTKPSSENTKASVMLQFGIDRCVVSQAPDLLTEFLDIKRLRAQVGGAKPAYLAQYQKMSNRRLDEKTVKRLFVQIMELHRKAKLAENDARAAEILALAKQVAEKHQLSEEANWLKRNYGEMPSHKNGHLGL